MHITVGLSLSINNSAVPGISNLRPQGVYSSQWKTAVRFSHKMFQLHSFECGRRRIIIALFNGELLL